MHGSALKLSSVTYRKRLYELLALLPPKSYEGMYTSSQNISKNFPQACLAVITKGQVKRNTEYN